MLEKQLQEPPPLSSERSRLVVESVVHRLLLIFFWLAINVIGFAFVLRYETTPGLAAQPPTDWPSQVVISRQAGLHTLILAVHPHCPCTRATLGELASIMAHTDRRLQAHVLFLTPANCDLDWEKTDLWRAAKAIPNTTVLSDLNGTLSSKFDCHTSGQALLYDDKGCLRFNGGITSSRGHHGSNAGSDAIVSLVMTGRGDHDHTLVFGCALNNRDSLTERSACKNLQPAQ